MAKFLSQEWIKEYQRLWNADCELTHGLRNIDATMKYWVDGNESEAVFMRLERGEAVEAGKADAKSTCCTTHRTPTASSWASGTSLMPRSVPSSPYPASRMTSTGRRSGASTTSPATATWSAPARRWRPTRKPRSRGLSLGRHARVLARASMAKAGSWPFRRGRVALEVAAPGARAMIIETLEEGDVVGWSWLFPPHRWSFDARAVGPVRAVAFDGACLRGKCEDDKALGYELMRRFAGVMLDRLQATRLQLLDVYGGAAVE